MYPIPTIRRILHRHNPGCWAVLLAGSLSVAHAATPMVGDNFANSGNHVDEHADPSVPGTRNPWLSSMPTRSVVPWTDPTGSAGRR
jgi:hypothetical protein